MLKVFLVEDEFVVRQGIKKNIAWESHGYEFCGEASDGELALPLIRKHKPDIVITDVRMPFMDGLELSRILRKEFPQMAIIILSGYEEFSYAKEAIQLGISSYLLKPISGDALVKEVDKVAENIRRIRREQEMQMMYRKEMEEIAQQERQRFFQDLVSGEKSVSELLTLADQYEIDLSAGCYNIILVKLTADNHLPQEFFHHLVEANAQLESLADEHLLVFDRELEGYGILVKADSEESYEQVKLGLLDAVRRIPDSYENICYAVGIGEPVNRLRELKKSFEHASHAFAHRYFHNGSCVIDPIPQGNAAAEDAELDLRNVDPKTLNAARVMEFLRTGDSREVPYFVENFMENVGVTAMESMMFRQYVLLGIYFRVVEFVEELQYSRDELMPLDMSLTAKDTSAARAFVGDLLKQALAMREQAASNRYGDMVDDTVRFIEENYANPDLSLNMAASHVKFSPNYLSKVFSEQTGETFIRFLTDYRINKAKELLRCTTKKSSVIAYEVGYKDPHYFSILFKKQTGLSPKQFRGGES